MTEPTMAPPETDDASTTPGWQERRGLLAVAAAAVVVLLGLGAWFLVFSGGESDDDGLVASARTPGAVSTGSAEPEPTVVETIPPEFAPDLGNDPFKPLYAPLVQDEPADDGTTDVVDAVDPGQQLFPDPNVPGGVHDGSQWAPYPGAPQAPSLPTTAPTTLRVKLVSVNADKGTAVLEVDGQRMTVRSNDQFGPNNQLTLHRVDDEGGGTATVFRGSSLEETAQNIDKGQTKKF